MSKETELLPCPFCGESASGYAIEAHSHALQLADGFKMPDHGGSYVVEGDCICGSGMIGESQQEVTSRWNRRAADRAPHQPADPELVQLHANGTKAWADVPDATKWVDELRGDEQPEVMRVVAYAYDDHEYGFAGSPCKQYADVPPGRAQNSEGLVLQSDALAALAAKDREIAELRRDAGRYALVRKELCDSHSTLLEDAFALAGCVGRFPDEPEFDSVVDAIAASQQGEKT